MQQLRQQRLVDDVVRLVHPQGFQLVVLVIGSFASSPATHLSRAAIDFLRVALAQLAADA